MALSKPKIDFFLFDNADPFSISLADTSEWSYLVEKPAIVEITTPGETRVVTHDVLKNQTAIFNNYNLNLGCGTDCENTYALDDGVYTFTMKGSPSTYYKTRKFLKTSTIDLEFSKIILGTNLGCQGIDRGLQSDILKIDFLIRAANSAVLNDDTCNAQSYLVQAQRMIEDIKGCGGCNSCATAIRR